MVIGAACCWGCTGIFVRFLTADGLTSSQIALGRLSFTFAILFLTTFFFDRKLLRIRLRDIWCFLGTGLLGIMLFNVCYLKTIQMTSMSVAAVLQFTSPIFVMLLSRLFFNEKITRTRVFALVLAISGVVFISGIIGGDAPITFGGLLMGITAGLATGCYPIFTEFALRRGYSPMTITTWTYLFAALGTLTVTNLSGISVTVGSHHIVLLLVLLCALLCTFTPYMLYTNALQFLPNSVAILLTCFEPVMATVMGFLVFGEVPSLMSFIGIALVIGAVIVLGLSSSSSKVPLEEPR